MNLIDQELQEQITDLAFALTEQEILERARDVNWDNFNLREILDRNHEQAMSIVFGRGDDTSIEHTDE